MYQYQQGRMNKVCPQDLFIGAEPGSRVPERKAVGSTGDDIVVRGSGVHLSFLCSITTLDSFEDPNHQIDKQLERNNTDGWLGERGPNMGRKESILSWAN